jgi:sucrose-6-phosphate hydrolase SacC (GH32 family)
MLFVEPVRELASLRLNRTSAAAGVTVSGSDPLRWSAVGDSVDVELALSVVHTNCSELSLVVLRSESTGEETVIRLGLPTRDSLAGHLRVDRMRSSLNPLVFRSTQTAAFRWPATEQLRVRVLVDVSIVEIFVLDTGVAVTTRVYPIATDATSIEVVCCVCVCVFLFCFFFLRVGYVDLCVGLCFRCSPTSIPYL